MTSINWHRLNRLLSLVLVTAIIYFATVSLLAQVRTESADEHKASGELTDLAFFAAGDLSVTATSTDDIFAIGGDVILDGAVADAMFVTGGDVVVTNSEFHDLFAAGGDLMLISGYITDDLLLVGGDVNVQSGLSVAGSAVLAAGSLVLDSNVGGELRATANRLSVNGTVGGDAQLVAETAILGPKTVISGDLRHRTQTLTVEPGAIIEGEIIELEPGEAYAERWGVRAVAAAAAFAIAFVIGVTILVIVVALALPGLMNNARMMIHEKPFTTLGIGVLIVVAAPAVIGLLFATILGIPLALMIGAIYVASIPIALAAVVYSLGMGGRNLLTKNKHAPGPLARLGWSLIAVVVFLLAGFIPFVGGGLWFLAYLIGMGAIMTQGGKALSDAS